MAHNQVGVSCPVGAWTQLTNADITAITFQVVSGSVKVRCTAGATPPALDAAGYVYHARPAGEQTEDGELRVAIADLAIGAGINRVYAQPIGGRSATVVVDHA